MGFIKIDGKFLTTTQITHWNVQAHTHTHKYGCMCVFGETKSIAATTTWWLLRKSDRVSWAKSLKVVYESAEKAANTQETIATSNNKK